MNTVVWAIGIYTEPTKETEVGVSSVQTDFRGRTFDSAGKSPDPLMEILLVPSKETIEIDRTYPNLVDTLSDIGGIVDIIF